MRLRCVLLTSMVLFAGSASAGGTELRDAWIRWLPAGAPMAGYFTLENGTGRAIALTGAASVGYGSVTLHRTVGAEDGSTSMEPVDLPLEIPPGSGITFEPGGYHLMLMQPRRAIAPGDRVRITLRTQSGEQLSREFEVRTATGQ